MKDEASILYRPLRNALINAAMSNSYAEQNRKELQVKER